jgi:hypothetical protein
MYRNAHFLADIGLGQVDNGFSRAVSRVRSLRKVAFRINRHLKRDWGYCGRDYFSYVLIWALARVGDRYASATADGDPRTYVQPEVVGAG